MGDDQCRPPSVDKIPWLITTNIYNNNKKGKLFEKQTFCTMSPMSEENKTYVKSIVELNGKYILGSCLGWLILREREDPTMYSLWNPVTLKSLHLAALLDAPEDDQKPMQSILTSPPFVDDDEAAANPESALLLFFEGQVLSCTIAMSTWAKLSLEYDGKIVNIADAVTVNGNVYANAEYDSGEEIARCENMIVRVRVVIGLQSLSSIVFEPLSSLELPYSTSTITPHHPRYRTYLVEVSGVLHMVHLILRQHDNPNDFDIFKAYVWRLDLLLPQMTWIPVESLGNRAFLLGDYGSTWCWGGTGYNNYALKHQIEADCIYMAKFKEKTVHSYSLRDNNAAWLLLPHRNFLCYADVPIWFTPFTNLRVFTSEEENKKRVQDMCIIEDDIDRNILSKLPSEMVFLVAHRMHLFDQLNLRLTCKTIRSAIPLHKWSRDNSVCTSTTTYPLFMSLKDNNQGIYVCELWDALESLSYTIDTPYSSDDTITLEFCKDRWLLIRIGTDSLEYFNLFTQERRKCASCPNMPGYTSCAFSTLPNDLNCLTLGVCGSGYVVIGLFQAATGNWDDRGFKDTDFWATCNSSPVWFDGAFYFIGVGGKLGAYVLVDGEWGLIIYDSPLTEKARKSLNSCYLVELDGQLACVLFQQGGKRVQVFKFDYTVEENWVELHDLGEYALFLSPASSFSVIKNDNIKRNIIYLPKRVGNEVVYYSLDTCKYHILGKEDCIDDFYGMTTQQFCCWI